MNGNVIRTITIRGTSEGLDKLQTDLVKLAAAHKGVAIAAEETDKKSPSLEQAWKRQTLRLDEAARAQNNIARETKTANQMLHEQRITTEQHAERLNLINQHYTKASQGAQTYGKALQAGTGETRLARHELINLSRQFQDVGVSLSSGQSPLTVLVQQGSQIADVFATSSGTIGGFFKQVGAGATRFLTSTTGIVTGVAAIGTALVAVGSNYESAQRDIEKALSGIGRASGVTRDQINEIADATSTWGGASVSQAREAATAFAATGTIYKENVSQATKIIDDYARSGGDAAEMTKTLGAALKDPAKGALELNKTYGFLNVTTLENIRLLQAQGKEQEAQKLLMDKLNPAIQKQAEYVSIWGRAWNVTRNFANWYFDDLGKAIARTGERMTGANLGGFTDEERLGRAKERVSSLKETIAQPKSAMQPAVPESVLDAWKDKLKEAEEEVKRLEKVLDKGTAAFDKLGEKAVIAADGFLPLQAQIRETEERLNDLRKYEAAGGYVDQNAIAAGELKLQQLNQQNEALARQNEYTLAIAASYPGMSIEVAKQLDALNGQLAVAQARTPAEQIVTQEYVTQNSLINQIYTAEERAALAAAQRAIAEANVAKQIQDQIFALEQEIELSKARIAGTEAATKAEQAYSKARRAGATEEDASNLSAATSRAEAQRATEQSTKSVSGNTNAVQGNSSAVQSNSNIVLGANQVYDELTGHILDYTASIIFWAETMVEAIDDVLDMVPTQFTDASGKRTQYGISYDPYNVEIRRKNMEAAYGKENVETYTRGSGIYAYDDVRLKSSYYDDINEGLEDLTKSNEDLTDSTDSLNDTISGVLSPYYSQDPRTTKLGFRAGSVGNQDWLTGATNETALDAILGEGATAPGMANGGSFVVGGGYSATDNRMAVFPVASGEEIVVNRNKGERGGQVVNIDNRIVITGTVDDSAIGKLKVSRYQQTQRIRAGLASA